MATEILDTENSTPTYRAANIIHVRTGEAVVSRDTFVMSTGTAPMPSKMLINQGVAVVHNVVIVERSGTSLNAEPLAPGELEFWFEKQAFAMIPGDQLAQHEGLFVASKDGAIVDADEELQALTDRFFNRFGDAPVYMTKIGGDEDGLRLDTPFFE